MKTLEIEQYGLLPINADEINEVDGGGLKSVCKWLWECAKTLVGEIIVEETYKYGSSVHPQPVPDSARTGCAMSPVRVY